MTEHRAGPLTRLVLLLPLAVACTNSTKTGTGRTEHERDSVIGQSKLPGAGGVKKALDLTDSSRARVGREDSIAESP